MATALRQPSAAAAHRYDLSVEDFPGLNGHPRVAYRAVLCTHQAKPTIVFLCEAPRSMVTSIYNAAEELYARLKLEHSLRDNTLFYNLDRNFPAALTPNSTDGVLLMPLAFSPDGRGSWGSVLTFKRVATKHGIDVLELKQLCLLLGAT